MTGLEPYSGALIKFGGTLVIRSAPKGLELIKSWWTGKTILIVGQPRAGKTTFLDYFHYGLWGDEKDTERTYFDLPSARFNVKVGRNETLQISVTTAVDTSGHMPAYQQAKNIFERKPHALLIFMDLTLPLKPSSEWLAELCRKFESHWRTSKSQRNRLKSIILVLNKKDKVDAKTITSRKRVFQKIIDAELKDARGKMLDDIAIIPTAMVENPDKTKSADDLIAHLAKSLIR
jgi:GTPase SAR1 family protein